MLEKLIRTHEPTATRLATFRILVSSVELVAPKVLMTLTAWLDSLSSWLPGTMTRVLILPCRPLTFRLVEVECRGFLNANGWAIMVTASVFRRRVVWVMTGSVLALALLFLL